MNWPRPIKRWLRTREFRLFRWGIPALLAGATWLAFGIWLAFWNPYQLKSHYAETAGQALAVKDFETIRVASQRLLGLGIEPQRKYLFNVALSLAGLQREKEAASLLATIAPVEKPGYLPAHLFIAQSLLAKTNVTSQEITTAERHLKHVLTLDPKSLDAAELLGRIYFRNGRWELAEKHLRDVVVVKPELSLLLAAVLKVQGDFIGARSWAERAAKFHREKVEAARLDDPENRLAWADALAMMEDYPGACLILESGWKQFGNGIYHAPLGEACSLWVQKLAVTAPGDLAFRIAIIQQGLEYAPQNEGLLKHLIALSHLEGQQAGAARSTLNRLLSEGKSTSILHFTLGIDAWQRQQTEEAKQHFAIAFDTAPKLPFVANNMAMILAVGNPPDPPRALDIIQPVVEKFPDNATFRDTRGQVLVLLGRWQEAVTDLEFALPQLSSPNRTHAALAEAYRGLGLKDLAAEHEQRAKGAPEGKGKVSPRQKS